MEIKTKSIKYNFIMNVILTVSSLVFPLITFPYITRVLLPEGTGKIAFANSVVSYFSMFSMLGIPTYGIRACAKVRDDKYELVRTVQEIWIINVVTTIIVCFVFFMAVLKVQVLRQNMNLMMICGLSIILNMFGMEWLYKGLECYTYITIRSVLFKASGTIFMFLMVHEKSDYLIYAFIAVLANTGYGFLNFIHAGPYVFGKRIQKYDFKRHFKPIVTFFAMSVAVIIYTNLDVVMLGILKDSKEVGYYDIAVKIKVILVNIVTALGAVVLPRVSYYIEKKQWVDFYNITSKAFELVAVISIPLMIYFIVMARSSILVLAGNGYLSAIPAMKIVMPTLVLIGFSNLLGIQMLIPMGKENVVVCSEIIGAIINVILNLVMIPQLGASGAAMGTLVAESAVLFVQYRYLKDTVKSACKSMELKKVMIGMLISIVTLFIIKSIKIPWPFVELLVTSIVFFASYGLTLIILKEPLVLSALNMVAGKNKMQEVADDSKR